MYCEFYQLTERPFNVTPDPKFLYLNARYREAIASLNYGITQRKGFITLIGEAGTGKTTLLNKLLEDLDPKTKSVFIFNTNVTFEDILEYIFAEFDLPVHNGKKLYMLQRLNGFLLEELRGGGNVALLIDEAQDLEFSVLEDLRLLSNLETAKEKILQIVLSGQPELGQKLSNPVLRQLRQRIGINCRLLPLSRDEITEYIQYRLQAAGCPDLKLFSREAEEQIYHFSRGIPRLVNVVCDNALVIGYALGKKRVGADIITEAAADLLSIEPSVEEAPTRSPVPVASTPAAKPPVRWRARLGVMALVMVALLVGLLSVGRTMLRKPNSEPSGPDSNVQRLEVIRPGSLPGGIARDIDTRPSDRVADIPVRPDTSAGNAPARAPVAPVGAADAERAARGVSAAKQLDQPNPPAAAIGAPAVPVRVPAGEPAPAVEHPVGARAAEEQAVAPPAVPPALTREAEVRPPAQVAKAVLRVDEPAGEVNGGGSGQRMEPAQTQGARIPRLDGVEFSEVSVRGGDSVSGIALRKYGQATYTILDLLKLANPDLKDIDVIAPGQTIRLPELGEGLPVLDDGSGRYALLVYSTPNAARASALQSALRTRGFDAQVSAGRIGADKVISRVVVAGFADRAAVAGVGKQLQRLFREDPKMAQLGE
jgi:general secretion pathway protein A